MLLEIDPAFFKTWQPLRSSAPGPVLFLTLESLYGDPKCRDRLETPFNWSKMKVKCTCCSVKVKVNCTISESAKIVCNHMYFVPQLLQLLV